ncbi:NPCBM/NEW2 domain-containing protein [Tessaracoccus rhinocerotis]|uniref:NPCBM/NEW2 domain-containing protein n=1 Tax=Tessaracoccus rhinocerotis TaxID=1689449 RepID=UPI00163D93E1|nr:NPCBM/NEW2 domain-containing protein [Tessaracoccus rhinocerotis]
MLLIAVVLLTAGAFIGGAVVGWRVHDGEAMAQSHPHPSVVTVTADPVETAPVGMPDVRGLSEETARQVIADAALGSSEITISSTQWAGPEGLVVTQSPVFGVAEPAEIDLVLSVPAEVPEAVGRRAADISREVSNLGAQVTIVEAYQPGAEAGTVLGIEPAAGNPLPAMVTVTQASPASSVYLREVEALQSDCRAESVRLDGPTYDFGMSCSVRETSESVWLLARVVDSIEGAVGIPDTADPTTTARVEIIVDGTVALDTTVAYGQPATQVDIDATGALRLVIRITNTNAELNSTVVALADTQIVGEASAVEGLTKE